VYEDKYKAITTAIPQEVLKRTQLLSREIRDIYIKFKENPSSIREYIEFNNIFHEEKSKLFILEKKIEDLLELEQMLYKNSIKIADSTKQHIT
jgi:hypothetical protein